MRKVKVFLFNGLLLTITTLIIRTIEMIFNVYIANKIGTEAIGVFQLIISVYMFFVTFASSGINLAATKIVSEQLTFGLETGIKKTMKKCLFYSFFMGIVACSILFVFSKDITFYWLHSKINTMPLKIIAISLPFVALSSCLNGYFSAILKIKKTVLSQILGQFFKILCITFFINFFLPNNLNYVCISLVLGTTISEAISFAILFISYISDKKKLTLNTYSDKNYSKQILKISVPIAITSYIRSGLSTLKQILIPFELEKFGMSCEYALSKYGMINGMVMPLILFPSTFIYSFSSLLIPEFSSLSAKKSYEKINIALNRIFKFCFVFSFLILGIFFCFSTELSILIYNKVEISNFILLLSPLVVLIYVDNIVDSILKGLNKQVSSMVINILDLISSIGLICFLLPMHGVLGYIIVLFISEALNGILSIIVLIKHTNLKIDFTNWIIKPFFSICLITLFFNLLINNYTNISFISFIFKVIVFVVLYFTIIILLKGLVKSDIKF